MMYQIYVLSIALVVCFASQFLPGAIASEKPDQEGIWVGVDLGAGNVRTSIGNDDNNETAHYLGFKVNYRFNSHQSVGVEFSGWTIGSSNLWNPGEGEGLSQFFAFTQYYPVVESGLFLKLSGGYTSHWNNQFGETKKRGVGIALGGGYDYEIQNDWLITPFLTVSIAETDDEEHDAWAIGVGLARKF